MFCIETHQNHWKNNFSMTRSFWINFSKYLKKWFHCVFCFFIFQGCKNWFSHLNSLCYFLSENIRKHRFSLCFCQFVMEKRVDPMFCIETHQNHWKNIFQWLERSFWIGFSKSLKVGFIGFSFFIIQGFKIGLSIVSFTFH